MCLARVRRTVLIPVAMFVVTAALAAPASAQTYYPRGYGGYGYRVPYRNDYFGYWRDQGYGFSPGLRGYYSPYRGGRCGDIEVILRLRSFSADPYRNAVPRDW